MMVSQKYTLNERKILQKSSSLFTEIRKSTSVHERKRLIQRISEVGGCSPDEARVIVEKYISFENSNDMRLRNEYKKEHVVRCPTCSSTNVHKISEISKAGSVLAFGIFSQKVKRQFHCDNCGYEW